MQTEQTPSWTPRWTSAGDVNAFFGLLLDNLAGLVLLVGILSGFGMQPEFIMGAMVPGTALGVLIGDLFFFVLAILLIRRTGRSDITAMPLGLDTPSTFGMCLFVIGPAFLAAKNNGLDETAAAYHAWHIGIWGVLFAGVLKAIAAPFSHWIRTAVPRAGLLGSLAAIAIVVISFFPLLEILEYPLVGLISLSILLTALVGRVSLPGKLPGALGALLVAGAIFYLLRWLGFENYQPKSAPPALNLWPDLWLQSLSAPWLSAFRDSLPYLPVVIPFAFATVVGGIDCTESAAAAGDEFSTPQIILGEAVATFFAGLCGAVIQTTPYIGHPAYKFMGARSGYVLGTALAMGLAGVSGIFALVYEYVPQSTVYPILIFVGLEIGAQSFFATERRHYPAVVFACVPALAYLAVSFPDQIFGDGALRSASLDVAALQGDALKHTLLNLRMLSAGFIVTSLLWASTLAAIIDGKLRRAAVTLLICAIATLLGVIHSPLPGSPLGLPFSIGSLLPAVEMPDFSRAAVWEYTIGYLGAGVLLALWSATSPEQEAAPQDPHAA